MNAFIIFLGVVGAITILEFGAWMIHRIESAPELPPDVDYDLPRHTQPRGICPNCGSLKTKSLYSGGCTCRQCEECQHIYNTTP